jgi:nucleoside-diphosphate-sugar epimerase
VAQSHKVRSLDVAPIDDPVERDVTEIRGDMRDPEKGRDLCEGADVLVHAAAVLPIRVPGARSCP